MSDMPEKVNVMWVKTYDVKSIISEIADASYLSEKDISDDDVMEYIRMAAEEAFHDECDDPNLIYQDEDGDILSI